MREAQKPDHVSLNSLLTRLKEGRYIVPDFQREFEWKARDIRDLTRSIFLDYYIGSLLLWKGTRENFSSLSCEPLYGQSEGHPEYIVLDGQQRLTAISYAFIAPDIRLPTRANRALYFLRIDRFVNEEYDEAFDFWYVTPGNGAGTAGWTGMRWPQAKQYAEHVFPLSVIGAGGWDLPNWVQGYIAYWKLRCAEVESESDRKAAELHTDNAVRFGEHIKSITETFQISYIELDRELAIDKVCDIFTQINSKGVRLDVFDLLNALLKPKGVQLKALWRDAAPRLEFIEGGKLNVYILQVMSLLRQSHCSPKYLYYLLPGVERKTRREDGSFERQVMVKTAEEFLARWSSAVAALEGAIERLRHPHEFGVSSSAYLPYYAILPVFAAALAEVKAQAPARRLAAEGRFRLWYWASIFTNRYSASSETTAARDIQDLRAWFTDEASEPPVIAEFKRKAATLDLRGDTKKGFAIYNAIFNLLVIAGARDWMSGAIPQPSELDDHHIVPKSWGVNHLQDNAIDTILNRTPMTGETNRYVIRDRLPNQYLPELISTNGREKVETLMQSHFISVAALDILLRDPFTVDDFDAFVRERQRTVTASIQSLLIGGRADLSPDLRGLDEDVERIELALRRLVATRLDNDPARLPHHIRPKVDGRIAGEIKRNPGLDENRFATLDAVLEFADLAELLETIVAKGMEAYFVDIFPTKEGLATKFAQLGALRNGIRHSRTVGEVARLEGQAAIQWFDEALVKAR
ncbi:GmrSD restriction endonuclease domain-containing protein [Allosphingosinicella sp.]|jgi:hypothetical protein|uniref:GmrSD restriction endonuclease domain-containing protein n=1 Tax=Allosphingosinicella sp. TaxID=2823234 RepID=UPI002F0E4C59